MGTKLDPVTKKITLLEVDLLKLQTVWFNWTAYVWYVDFDAVYDLIDPAFLAGVSAQAVISVGSVRVDGILITQVLSIAATITTPGSFFFDSTSHRVYIHIAGNAEPSLHAINFGLTSGIANHAMTFNGVYYEPRLSLLPTLRKSKDPLFFGRIAMGSNTVAIDNTDGAHDMIGENQAALFGSEVRLLQGFDDDAYASFIRIATRMIENVRVSNDNVEFDCVDKRKGLTVSIPKNTFSSATYPLLDLNDIGKPIPLVYGKVYKVPGVCTNQTEAGPPAQFHFKLADTVGAGHNIKSVDHVYVNNKPVAFSSVDLTTATFDISSALYVPGDEVAVTMTGFEVGGTAITNAAAIILDLLYTWLDITYDAVSFNTTEWAAVTASLSALFTSGIGLFLGTTTELYTIIQDICASCALNLIPQDDGRFTLRMYDAARTVSQDFTASDLLEVPSYEYETSQLISYACIEYARNWLADSPRRLMDLSQDAAIYAVYNKHVLGTFKTLLTTEADAQALSTILLSLQGQALRTFTIHTKLQPFDLEIMDFITCTIARASKNMIGRVKAEIISKSVTASKDVVLGCRIVANI